MAGERLGRTENIRSSIATCKNICSNCSDHGPSRAGQLTSELKDDDRPALTRRCREQLQRIARFALEHPHGCRARHRRRGRRQGARCSRRRWCASPTRWAIPASPTCSRSSASACVARSRQLPRAHRGACAASTRPRQRRGQPRCCTSSSPTRSPSSRTSRSTSSAAPAPRRRSGCSPAPTRIHVLAQRRAFPVACYLAYALAQLELPAHAARRRRRHAARAGARHRADATCWWP